MRTVASLPSVLMSNERLPTEFWVQAQLRRLGSSGTGAYLLRRGDTERGTVIVRLAERGGVRILIQVRDLDGKLAWMGVKEGAVLSESDANAYVDRAVSRDSDLWVIEIETKPGDNPFAGELAGF
jgi:hypothetical protein